MQSKNKIYNTALSSDKDCIEDLRVYLTTGSQEIIERATSVKSGVAELISAKIDVEPVSFNRGFYTVDVRYYYRIIADAFIGAVRPVEVMGFAVFDKRVMLYGGEGCAKTFTSCPIINVENLICNSPLGVVEAVDPLVLSMKLLDNLDCCDMCAVANCTEIPLDVEAHFPEELVLHGGVRRLCITLGQFSIVRLERDAQMLMPIYDYCMPGKSGCCGGENPPDDPCELFRQVNFPVDEFCLNGGGCNPQCCCN